MASTKKTLRALIDLLFASSPTDALKTVLETAVDQIDPAAKTWEQLYIDAFQAAVKEMTPQLARYASADGELGLDEGRLHQALQADLSLHNLAESDLRSAAFLDALTERLIALDALYIGGNQLSSADTRQLVEKLVKEHAPAQFKALVEHDEDAFRQAVRREALKTNTALDEVQAYLTRHHALTLDLLRAMSRQLDELPQKIVDEFQARVAVGPTTHPLKRLVFISYARADHPDEGKASDCFVQQLYRALQDEGFTPWLDHHDLPSRGAPFPKDLALAVQQSERFIAVCGPAYPGSEWASAEREHAQLHCVAVMPILVSGEFDTSVPADIGLQNAIDMRAGFGETWPELLKRLKEPVSVPGQLEYTEGELPDLNDTDLPRPALFDHVKHSLRADQTDAVTISGTRAMTAMYAAGGIGKSKLAAQIAHDCEVRRGFPDGVVWVRLGELLVDPETLRVKVAARFGLPLESVQGEQGAVVYHQHLREKDALIVLDDVWSAEQVRACRVNGPNLRYLITTRLSALGETLGVPPENRVRVDYLDPDEGSALIAKRLGLNPEEDYPHKSVHRDIAVQLGGHTQAIDMAAAHLRPPREGGSGPDYAPTLLEQLRRGDDYLFELLMRSVDDESREGNLHKSLSVSYDMLPTALKLAGGTVDLQRCFRLLAVFAPGGSFDPAAVAAVWEMDDPARADRLLKDLVGRSLVQATETANRYSLHALIHAAARVLLSEGDAEEADLAAQRHIQYYLAAISHHDDAGTYPRMLPDLPQLLHAFDQAEQQGNLDAMQALLDNAANLLRQFGQVRTHFRWATVCLEFANERGDREAIGRAFGRRGSAYRALATVQGEDLRACLLQALADYEEALELLRDVPRARASILNNRASIYIDLATVQGEDRHARLLQALADLGIALELFRDVPLGKAGVLHSRGTVYYNLAALQGEDGHARLLQALADYDKALDLRRDMPLGKAGTLNNRATVYIDLATVQGEDRHARLLQALADLGIALELFRDVPLYKAGVLHSRGTVYYNLANLKAEDGHARLLQALADFDAALELRRDVPLESASTLRNRATVYRALATVQGEDRRTRMLQALQDSLEAVTQLEALQYPVSFEIGWRNLISICQQIVQHEGFETLNAWWHELTGGQPLPDRLLAQPQTLSPEDAARIDALADLLIEWVKTPDWASSQEYITAHADELLSDDAETALQDLIQANDNHQTLVDRLTLLRACRKTGIEAAYRERTKPPVNPDALNALLNVSSAEEHEKVISDYPELAELPVLTMLVSGVMRAQEAGEHEFAVRIVALTLPLLDRYNRQHDDDIDVEAHIAFIALHEPLLAVTEAADILGLAEAVKESMSWALNTLGKHSSKSADTWPKAIEMYTRAIEHAHNNAMLYRNRAGTYIDLREFDAAEADLAKAAELEPDAPRLEELRRALQDARDGSGDA